jgi:cobalt-zinc-cadmium efflux system protein
MSDHHHSHAHSHHHDHHGHHHGAQLSLAWPIALTLGFAVVEAVGGWMTGSLALLGDAGHMLSDAAALGLAWLAARIALLPATKRHSYGLVRVEVIVALANGLFMLAVVGGIVIEAMHRFSEPQPVAGKEVMVIAFIGLLVNMAAAWHLHKGERNINSRAALLHVMGDMLGSIAAIAAGAVIYFTGWTPIDPILSLLISLLIVGSTFNLLREALHVLMEGVPLDIDLHEVEGEMRAMAGVASIHDVHIWTLSSGKVVLSGHVVTTDMNGWMPVLNAMRDMLHDRYGINHVTLQPETEQCLDNHCR